MKGPVRAVLFDYGHTLITFERPETALLQAYEDLNRFLTARLARDVPAARDLVVGVSHAVDDEIARYDTSDRLEELEIVTIYDGCLRRLGLELDPQLIEHVMEVEQRAWLNGVQVGPDVVPTLDRIREAGLKIGLVSNVAFRSHLMRAQIDYLGLLSYFDSLSFSSEVGYRKPHPAIFTDALHKLGITAEAALFVGDRLKEDIQGAQALGMRTVLVHEWRQEEDPQGIADFTIGRLGDLWSLLELLRRPSHTARASYN